MHGKPAAGWTVASLAGEAGVLRVLFARRFSEVMGQSPLAYLTECRMDEAEELLADRSLTVAQVAEAVAMRTHSVRTHHAASRSGPDRDVLSVPSALLPV